MRIIFFVAVISFLSATALMAQDQNSKLEVKVETKNANENNKGEITIIVESSHPGFTYQVFDKQPWLGGKELKKIESTYNTKEVFSDLDVGKYFVCVTDQTNSSKCEFATIREE